MQGRSNPVLFFYLIPLVIRVPASIRRLSTVTNWI